MRSLKSHLIDDWRSAWKFGSVQFSALSVVMNVYGAIALKGAAAAASVLGIFSMRQALLIGAAVSAGALIARFRKRKPKLPPIKPDDVW